MYGIMIYKSKSTAREACGIVSSIESTPIDLIWTLCVYNMIQYNTNCKEIRLNLETLIIVLVALLLFLPMKICNFLIILDQEIKLILPTLNKIVLVVN